MHSFIHSFTHSLLEAVVKKKPLIFSVASCYLGIDPQEKECFKKSFSRANYIIRTIYNFILTDLLTFCFTFYILTWAK